MLLETFIYSALCIHYNIYLQKLSYSYEDLIICFEKKFDCEDNKLPQINLKNIHYISKIQNILNHLLKVIQNLFAI